MADILIRESNPSDRGYIFDTIQKTLLENSAYCHRVSPETIDLLVEPIFATYRILIAAAVEDPKSILGYIVWESPTVVAWIYVRAQFRSEVKDGKRVGGGICRALLEAAEVKKTEIICPLMVTGLNGSNFQSLANSKGYKLRFRPYLPLEIQAALFAARE